MNACCLHWGGLKELAASPGAEEEQAHIWKKLGPGWKVWGWWRQEDIGTCCVLFSLARAPPAWALTTGAGCCRDQLPLLRSCAQSGQGFKRSQECGPVIQKICQLGIN